MKLAFVFNENNTHRVIPGLYVMLKWFSIMLLQSDNLEFMCILWAFF